MTIAIETKGEKPGKPVLVLTAGGSNPWMIINHVAQYFPNVQVVLENPESKRALLKRRMKRFGLINAAGQLGTMIVSRIGKRFSVKRLDNIARTYGLSMEPNPSIVTHRVESLNDPDAQTLLRDLEPAAVLTISCRILSRDTLGVIPCPVINLHSGINPNYRGQMGGYWALVNNDVRNFGATVHLVDAGIDTGDILYEIRGAPGPGDSMLTYPALLTALSANAVVTALRDAIAGRLVPQKPGGGPSKHWFNVPVWTWLWNGLTKRIW